MSTRVDWCYLDAHSDKEVRSTAKTTTVTFLRKNWRFVLVALVGLLLALALVLYLVQSAAVEPYIYPLI